MCVKNSHEASVSHRQTIADLTNALKAMNKEARACIADTEIVQSEATHEAIAKFYPMARHGSQNQPKASK